jgi:hypothetical protein
MIFPRHCERPTVSIRIVRHCERSEAIHLAAQRKNGLLRRFAPRNDVGHSFAISRRDAPEVYVQLSPQKSEGAGNAGRPERPQPRVVCSKHAR